MQKWNKVFRQTE